MKRIEKLNSVCGVLKTFSGEHPESLDAKGAAELSLVQERISEIARFTVDSRQNVVSARSRRDNTFVCLRRSITESKKALEMVAVRDGRSYVLPRVGKDIWLPNRINMLAVKYLETLEAAGTDPVYAKLIETLNAALAAYTDAWGDTAQKLFAVRNFRKEVVNEIAELAGKVDAFSLVIAFHVAPERRKELHARLRAALPRNVRKNNRNPEIEGADQNQKPESDPATTVSDPSNENQPLKSAA